jgi:hypothetical protein
VKSGLTRIHLSPAKRMSATNKIIELPEEINSRDIFYREDAPAVLRLCDRKIGL